jgi:hypothetical protein
MWLIINHRELWKRIDLVIESCWTYLKLERIIIYAFTHLEN